MKKTFSIFFALIFTVTLAFPNFYASARTYPVGDVNSDNIVNSDDMLAVLQFVAEPSDATDGTNFDISGDGKIDTYDAFLICSIICKYKISIRSFEIISSTESLPVGGKAELKADNFIPVIADNKSVTWSSSNTAVAKVSESGTVTAVAVGDATIKAVAKDNSGASSEIQIHVGGKVTSVRLKKEVLTLSQGNTYNLNPDISPASAYNKKLNWTTSDSDIATVSASGEVKAQRIGQAIITCTTTDSSNIQAQCKVTVTSMKIPYVSQLPNYPTGCEAASACMLLKYYGFDVTLDEVVKAIPSKNLYTKNGKTYGPSIYEMFVGDPRGSYTSSVSGYGAFSPVITKAMQKIIDNHGGGYKAVNVTGCTSSELLMFLRNGRPLVVWATYKMQTPQTVNAWYVEGTGEYFSYPRGTHVMILSGYSPNRVTTVDPYNNGELTFTISQFKSKWELLGNQAIIIVKNSEL